MATELSDLRPEVQMALSFGSREGHPRAVLRAAGLPYGGMETGSQGQITAVWHEVAPFIQAA